MHNTIFTTWVKNVNKQCVQTSITSDQSSTTTTTNTIIKLTTNVQLLLSHSQTRFFNTNLSTYIFKLLHPLFVSYPYYPQYLLLELIKKN